MDTNYSELYIMLNASKPNFRAEEEMDLMLSK